MGRAMELITAQVTNAGAGGTQATASAGDSLQVRNGDPATGTNMLQLWSKLQSPGFVQVVSSFLHDTTRGMRFSGAAAEVDPYFAMGSYQRLRPQDTLTPTIACTDAAGDLEYVFMLNHYENLPGIDSNLKTWEEIKDKIVNITTVQATITAGVGGGYTGSEALNAESDLLHANTNYAVLGISVQVLCGAVTLKGPDTGNMRVGVPGNITDRYITDSFFVDLSRKTGKACIPVINSANKAGTFIEVVQDENGAAVPCAIILGELDKAL